MSARNVQNKARVVKNADNADLCFNYLNRIMNQNKLEMLAIGDKVVFVPISSF